MLETLSAVPVIFTFAIIIYSIILHEIAHGYAAYVQGDETAYRLGRLTLNPLPHIDMMGSVFVPLFAFLSFGTFFGWAKPVPYNVYNIRTKIGHAFVAAAGVMTNILLAVLTGIVLKALLVTGNLSEGIGTALLTIIKINVSLAFFNLIPVPPFDGMSIIQAFFPRLHINSGIIYNPLYMIVAIIVASSIYGVLAPHIFGVVNSLIF